MKLNTREWGTGDRIALLVHGIMSDHRTWRRVGPALADRGYRVIAVDLRGHGESPRGEYSPELFAEDLVETLPGGAELAVGHSLGGLALSLAAERLAPARAVYSDPAWASADPAQQVDPAIFVHFARATRDQIAGLNPRWEEADIEVELATLALWDTDSAGFLGGRPLTGYLPQKPAVPSLVQLAENSFLIGPDDAGLLSERGFGIRTVRGAGHTIHRDDFDGFFRSLDGWI
ncbi:alpha/beta fold hydrolase [Streptomyces fildesensis]|uniref:Alpha/beta fold hydrolase n=1 Tax=Streptomyces fildesensis TaxID=375757 RepID=A0ABW8CK03_9ACTN